MGSTEDARRAGPQDATAPARLSTTTTAPSEAGSAGDNPATRNIASGRISSNAVATPMSDPVPTSRTDSVNTIRAMSCSVAPNASLTPIS